jgi:hypothetical protein
LLEITDLNLENNPGIYGSIDFIKNMIKLKYIKLYLLYVIFITKQYKTVEKYLSLMIIKYKNNDQLEIPNEIKMIQLIYKHWCCNSNYIKLSSIINDHANEWDKKIIFDRGIDQIRIIILRILSKSYLKLEKNIFKGELARLINFAVLSENKLEVLRSLEELCHNLEMDIYDLANIEEEKYN